MNDEEHECSQRITLNTICIKLENIEKVITKIEAFQTNYAEQIEAVRLNSAKYPSPESVSTAMDKVKNHDTYFAIGGTGLVAAWGLLLWVVDKFWIGA
jgi:tetrahydromethanopterin S-methyltransferase subunit B